MYSLKDTLFVYINLDERVDKNIHMINLLDSMGVNYVRFSAIKPTIPSLTSGEYKYFYDKSVFWMKHYLESDVNAQLKLAIGTYGCYLSHFKILEKYASYGSIVVLEDDVSFNIRHLKKFFRNSYDLFKIYPNKIDLIRPIYGSSNLLENHDGILNSAYRNFYSFKSPYRLSKFVGDEVVPNSYFGASHFVYYHNIKNVLDYLYQELVYNIDAIFSTNVIHSFLLGQSKIWQSRKTFSSDIGSFKSAVKC